MKKKTNTTTFKTGFTLVELLLYVALVSVFLVVVTSLLLTILDVRTRTITDTAVNQSARRLLAQFKSWLMSADSVSSPLSVGESSSTLTFTQSDGVWSIALVGDQLVLTDATASSNLVSEQVEVSNFLVTRKGGVGQPQAIEIDLSLRQANQPTADSLDVSTVLLLEE